MMRMLVLDYYPIRLDYDNGGTSLEDAQSHVEAEMDALFTPSN